MYCLFEEILKRRGVKQRSALSKHVESQTDVNQQKSSQFDNTSLNDLLDKRNQSTPKLSHKLENKQSIAEEEKPVEVIDEPKNVDKTKDSLVKIEQSIKCIEYQEEIKRLNADLKSAQDLILKFQREETVLQEKYLFEINQKFFNIN